MAESIFNLQVVGKRKLDNWIEAWIEYTEELPSPVIWRKWGGIAAVAGAMERKVFTKTAVRPLYPNLYTILVGPPGTGKTTVTSEVWNVWHELSEEGRDNSFHLAASSLTSASIVDELREANRRVIPPDLKGDPMEFNSLAIASNELGVLLPDYDTAFMSKLTDLYDGLPYSERRRTKELNFEIPRPQINIIAAATPSYMTSFLPEGAWEQGFMSRTIVVVSSETITRSIFHQSKRREDLYEKLIHDMRLINSRMGKMTWEENAANAIQAWADAGGQPIPEHPKLMHYNTRRVLHLLKLCMVASVSESDDLVITLDHFQTALGWLLEVEILMPDIFKSMVVGGDAQAMQECWYHFLKAYAMEQKPISEHRIIEYLGQRLPAFNVPRVLDVMVRGKLFEEVFTGVPGKFYKPRDRKPSS